MNLNILFSKLRDKKFFYIKGNNNNNVISLFFSTKVNHSGDTIEVIQWEHFITLETWIGSKHSDEIQVTELELHKYIDEI